MKSRCRTACWRPIVAALLVIQLPGFTAPVTAGVKNLIPKSSFIANPGEPLRLDLRKDLGSLEVELTALVAAGGEGAWYREAKWDEYVVTLGNKGDRPITINSIRLIDVRGVYISSEFDQNILMERTEKLAGEYSKYENWELAQAAVGVGVVTGALGAGVASIAFAPGVVLAGPAYLYWRSRVYRRDMKRIETELNQRTVPVPLTLAPSGSATASFFFPIGPSPPQLVVEWQSMGEPVSQLLIGLETLATLHLSTAPAEHPVVEQEPESTPPPASSQSEGES